MVKFKPLNGEGSVFLDSNQIFYLDQETKDKKIIDDLKRKGYKPITSKPAEDKKGGK